MVPRSTLRFEESWLTRSQFSLRKLCCLKPSRADIERQQVKQAPTQEIMQDPPLGAAAEPQPLAEVADLHLQVRRRHRFRKSSKVGITFDPWFLVDCILATSHLRNVASLKHSWRETLDVAVSGGHEAFQRAAERVGFRWPGRHLLYKGRVRLDCALMLLSRKVWARNLNAKGAPFTTRELMVDASRGFGREILGCRENVLTFTGIDSPPSVISRRMPTVSLAHHHMTAADKTMALLHSVWLEKGPYMHAVLAWCRSIRAVPTDMGVESYIANSMNVVPALFGKEGGVGYTFPLALRVSGWHHIMDNAMKFVTSKCLPWFLDWLSMLRTLSGFLHLKCYRDVLENFAGQGMKRDVVDQFNEIRWGSVVSTTRRVSSSRAFLEAGWDDAAFNLKAETSSTVRMLASKSPESDLFWLRCQIVLYLLEPVEDLRTWGSGCNCHEVDRMEGRRVQCGLAGRRMRWAWPRIQEFLLRDRVSETGSLPQMSSDITDEVAAAAAVLKGTVHDRTSFLDCLPYKLARLRAPGVAEQVLQRFDSMSEEGVPHHRVSAHFLAKDSRLRTHVVALAAGEALHFELAQELMGIEWGLISEVDIEGEHRNLGLEKQRAHAVGHAFAVATVRIKENRETLSAVRRDPILSRLFLSCWKSWKAVAEDPKIVSKMWLRLSPQVRKRSFRETTSIAYRLGKSSFADFSNLKGLFVDKTSRQQPLQGGDCEKLLSDYVQSSMEIGKVYSVPSSCDFLLTDMQGILDEIPADLPIETEGANPQRMYFRLLHANVRRQKGIITSDALFGRGATATVAQVQVLRPSLKDCSVEQACLWEGGLPTLIDISTIAPLCSWLRWVRVWNLKGTAPPHLYQHSLYESPGFLRVDGGDIDIPMAIASLRLGELGWEAGRPSKVSHTPHDPDPLRLCLEPGFSERPSYAVCLLQLQELFAAGLSALYADQLEAYYKAILIVARKDLVLPGQKHQWYTAMIKGKPLPEPTEPRAKRPRIGIHEDDVPFLQAMLRAPEDAAMGAGDTSPPDAAAIASESESDNVPRVVSRCVKALPQKHPSTTAAAMCVDQHSSSKVKELGQSNAGSSTAQNTQAKIEPSPEMIHSDVACMSPEMIELHKAAIHPDIPIVIEGCPIRLSVSVSLSGESARKHVVCSHPNHVDCNKSRSLTLCKSFGQMEVVAFLGCWIKGASKYADREDHMGWKPSLKEVKGYVKSMR